MFSRTNSFRFSSLSVYFFSLLYSFSHFVSFCLSPSVCVPNRDTPLLTYTLERFRYAHSAMLENNLFFLWISTRILYTSRLRRWFFQESFTERWNTRGLRRRGNVVVARPTEFRIMAVLSVVSRLRSLLTRSWIHQTLRNTDFLRYTSVNRKIYLNSEYIIHNWSVYDKLESLATR